LPVPTNYSLYLHAALPISSSFRLGIVRLRVRAPRRVLGRAAAPPPPVVRVRRHEVRHPQGAQGQAPPRLRGDEGAGRPTARLLLDRKSTRLNSSHLVISYA